MLLVVGDVHGNIDLFIEKVNQLSLDSGEPIDAVLQVGDFGVYTFDSPMEQLEKRKFWKEFGDFHAYMAGVKKFPWPVYFCHGNHEDFSILKKYTHFHEIVRNLFYMPSGSTQVAAGTTITFVGGNYSPSRWENGPTAALKSVKYLYPKDICKALTNSEKSTILIVHESPFNVGGREVGCPVIRDLVERMQPEFCFNGHIHHYDETTIGRTKCVSLDDIKSEEGWYYIVR